jgi:hypothetical protein
MRISVMENTFRLGLPLIATPKDQGGYRSIFEVQVGVRFSMTDYRVTVETFEPGFFVRF